MHRNPILVSIGLIIIAAIIAWKFATLPARRAPVFQLVQTPEAVTGTGLPASGTLPTKETWTSFRNSNPTFAIDYPASMTISHGDGTVNPPAGPGYVLGTSSFWFGTMKLSDIESAPGRPVYAALVVMPTQCLLNYWGAAPTSTLVVSGISMNEQDYSSFLHLPGTLLIFTFPGDPSKGWSATCNTIEIVAPKSDELDLGAISDLWQVKTYESVLGTFRFTE